MSKVRQAFYVWRTFLLRAYLPLVILFLFLWALTAWWKFQGATWEAGRMASSISLAAHLLTLFLINLFLSGGDQDGSLFSSDLRVFWYVLFFVVVFLFWPASLPFEKEASQTSFWLACRTILVDAVFLAIVLVLRRAFSTFQAVVAPELIEQWEQRQEKPKRQRQPKTKPSPKPESYSKQMRRLKRGHSQRLREIQRLKGISTDERDILKESEDTRFLNAVHDLNMRHAD